MSAPNVAYSGSKPTPTPQTSIFDFVFSSPFQHASQHVPTSQTVPRVDDATPIFVDNKTDTALTYGRLRRDALTVAANLRRLGLDPDDTVHLPPTPTCQRPELAPVVLVQLPNCLAFAPVVFGVFASGLTASLAAPALTASELGWIVQNARPRAVVTAKATLPAVREALRAHPDQAYAARVPVFVVDPEQQPQYPFAASASIDPAAAAGAEHDWTCLLSEPPVPVAPYRLPPGSAANRTAVILWSSGTSGRSKGVLHSHSAIVFSMVSLWYDADFHKPGLRQRWMGYIPFYHVFGLCNIFVMLPCIGATCYVMPAFNLDEVCASVARRQVTYLHMAPPVAVMLAKSPVVEKYRQAGGFRSVIAGVTGGAPLGHEVVVAVYRRLGFRVRMGYGLSETCNTAVQKGTGEAHMHADAGDSGSPHWGVELMIAAADDGQGDPKGAATRAVATQEAESEILIRSPGLLQAYLPIGGLDAGRAPDMSTTNEALTPDGWFRTGDVGYLDAKGHVRITDRLKEMIKVRAYQVAPAELEAVLCSSDLVADAGVVGVYDKDEATEWPRAYVVPRQAELLSGDNDDRPKKLEALAAELRALVEARTAKYKWLKGGIVFVEAIPKSPSGKILRRVIKDGGVKGGIEVAVYQKKQRDFKL